MVPLTLVLSGDLRAGPYVLRLRVPSYDPIDPKAESCVVSGSFNVDLFSLTGMPKLPQTCQVWAFAGEVVGGPATMAIVTEDMLKR